MLWATDKITTYLRDGETNDTELFLDVASSTQSEGTLLFRFLVLSMFSPQVVITVNDSYEHQIIKTL